jgi:hydrogenase maturation protease
MTALVVALGHPDRGDDAVAGLVAAHLRSDPPPGCEIRSVINPVDLLDAWAGFDPVVVVDAVDAGTQPGSVSILREEALASIRSASGTHDLGLADVVAMAGSLDRRPPRLAVVGIQAEQFEVGTPVSPAVAEAVPAAVAAVRDLLGRPDQPGGGFRP